MKKIFVVVIIMALWLTSCNANIENEPDGIFQNSRTRLLDALTDEESVKINQMSSDIIKCFTEKDKELLKSLFCERVRNKPDFDKEIDLAFEYFDCDVYITSIKKESGTGGGTHTRKGKRLEWTIIAEIPYLKILTNIDGDTEEDDDYEHFFYSMDYYWQVTYDGDSTFEGLHFIVIELLNIDEMVLGDRTEITTRNPFH